MRNFIQLRDISVYILKIDFLKVIVSKVEYRKIIVCENILLNRVAVVIFKKEENPQIPQKKATIKP